MDAKPIIIAGAGIGGLTAAIGLRQRGREVVVLERAPELREAGAGITIQTNAMSEDARRARANWFVRHERKSDFRLHG